MSLLTKQVSSFAGFLVIGVAVLIFGVIYGVYLGAVRQADTLVDRALGSETGRTFSHRNQVNDLLKSE